ncbi:hypothetical protein JTE90_001951 [Oedothorax gibbosus]|uniref:Uncharacterized protein n=1 Tax=Oedothorax gibbosus TaxID=931172 RepID=A0AAV6VU74_9ARAC|nr:hypothetical protein JTE90_001951 [Oedothorax gibbosus]
MIGLQKKRTFSRHLDFPHSIPNRDPFPTKTKTQSPEVPCGCQHNRKHLGHTFTVRSQESNPSSLGKGSRPGMSHHANDVPWIFNVHRVNPGLYQDTSRWMVSLNLAVDGLLREGSVS